MYQQHIHLCDLHYRPPPAPVQLAKSAMQQDAAPAADGPAPAVDSEEPNDAVGDWDAQLYNPWENTRKLVGRMNLVRATDGSLHRVVQAAFTCAKGHDARQQSSTSHIKCHLRQTVVFRGGPALSRSSPDRPCYVHAGSLGHAIRSSQWTGCSSSSPQHLPY